MKVLFKRKVLFGINVLFAVINAILSVIIAFLIQKIIDIAVAKDTGQIPIIIIAAGILVLLNVLIGYLECLSMNQYVKKTFIEYKNNIIKRLLNKDVNSFRSSNTGSYISVINNDIKVIEMEYVIGTFSIIKQIALLSFGIAGMLYISPWVFLTAAVFSLLPILASIIFNAPMTRAQENISQNNKRFTTAIKDLFNGFLVIKSYNIEDRIISNISGLNKDLENSKKKYGIFAGWVSILNSSCGFIVVIACFTVGSILCTRNIITVGSIVAIIQLLNYLLGPIQQISLLSNKRNAAKKLVVNIEDLLQEEEEHELFAISKTQLDHAIEFKHVSFAYDNVNEVIHDASLKFEKGKKYAIVGLSGSGKTTLINLLMGHYRSFGGDINFDGASIRNIARDTLYKMMTIIQQDVFIFDDSIRNNLTMYEDYGQEQIEKAVASAELAGFIEEKGFDSMCGENGNLLSGGEKQRLSIGRALIKNTNILILDEATSALDNTTSFAIEQTLLNLKDTTGIVITHKMNEKIMAQYDEILVMDKGRIIELGNFNSLMQAKGMFYSIYNVSNSN